MNGTTTTLPQNASARQAKPVPAGPAPPAPAAAPPVPPNHSHSTPANRASLPSHNHASTVNGTHTKGKKRNDAPVDPAAMYESLKNRIAALEEEEVLEEEEEKRFGVCLVSLSPPTINPPFSLPSRGSAKVRERNGGECYSRQIHRAGACSINGLGHSATLWAVPVRRTQENGARSREGETKVGQRQGRRSVSPFSSCTNFSLNSSWHGSKKPIDESKSNKNKDGEPSSRTAKGDHPLFPLTLFAVIDPLGKDNKRLRV